MHVSVAATCLILLPFLGGSQAARESPFEDAFGETNYGYQCGKSLYTKSIAYATAKHFCDNVITRPRLKIPTYHIDVFPNAVEHELIMKSQVAKYFGDVVTLIPILDDGTFFPFGSNPHQKSAGKMDMRDPGPDRLAIDKYCDLVGIFRNLNHKKATNMPNQVLCERLYSEEDFRGPSAGFSRPPKMLRYPSRQQSTERSLKRYRQQSPEGSLLRLP